MNDFDDQLRASITDIVNRHIANMQLGTNDVTGTVGAIMYQVKGKVNELIIGEDVSENIEVDNPDNLTVSETMELAMKKGINVGKQMSRMMLWGKK